MSNVVHVIDSTGTRYTIHDVMSVILSDDNKSIKLSFKELIDTADMHFDDIKENKYE